MDTWETEKQTFCVCCTQGLSEETGRDLIIRSVLPGEGKRLALWTQGRSLIWSPLWLPRMNQCGMKRQAVCVRAAGLFRSTAFVSKRGPVSFCFAVMLICCVVFDLRQMVNLLCPRQRFKPSLTRGRCSEPSVMPVWLGCTTAGNKYKAVYYYQFIIILSHSAAVAQQGTS